MSSVKYIFKIEKLLSAEKGKRSQPLVVFIFLPYVRDLLHYSSCQIKIIIFCKQQARTKRGSKEVKTSTKSDEEFFFPGKFYVNTVATEQ